jgi:hypothetical protein
MAAPITELAAPPIDRSATWHALGVLVLSLISGLLATLVDLRPVESTTASHLLAFGFGFAAAWAAAATPWWILVPLGLITAIAGFSPLPIALALVATLGAVALGLLRRELPTAGAAIGLVLAQALLHLQVDRFHGASALVAGIVFVILLAAGILARTEPAATVGLGVAILVGLAALAATVGLLAALALSNGELRAADKATKLGLQDFDRGDTVAAAAQLNNAANHLAKARDRLEAWWAKPAAFVPLVSQHRQLAEDLARAGASSARDAAQAAGSIQLDALSVAGGKVDLNTVQALQAPLQELTLSLERLDHVVAGPPSPWIVAPVQKMLRTAHGRVDQAHTEAKNAAAVAAAAPAMLGGNGARHYLFVFTTKPGQAGPYGAIDGYAEVAFDHGAASVVKAGRGKDLQGNPADAAAWDQAGKATDVATAARSMAAIYQRQGAKVPIDGVVVTDPEGVAALLRLSGPVTPLGGQQVEADGLVTSLAAAPDNIRGDLLALVASSATQRLVTAQLPAASQIGKIVSTAVDDGHVAMWAARPDEQALLTQLGADGS